MEEKQTTISTTRVGLKYGIFTGLAFIIYEALIYSLRLDDDLLINMLSLVISVAGIVYGIREFMRFNEGFMRFGQGLGIGMLASAISGIIDGFFRLIYFKYLNPSLIEDLKSQFLKQLEKSKMKDEELDMAEKMLVYLPEFIFVGTILGALVLGLILSLIITAIMQKERSPFE